MLQTNEFSELILNKNNNYIISLLSQIYINSVKH